MQRAPGGSAPHEVLAAALARSQSELQEAAAGQALCRIDGSGGPTPFFVKRAEGARAALVDVRRAVRHDAALSVADAARNVLEAWRAELAGWRARGSGPWVAYSEGGCAAVEALLDDLG